MRTIIRPSLYGLGLTVLWIVLASANPSTTYHLAPLLVAIAVPVGSVMADRTTVGVAAGASIIGVALTYGATAGLAATDSLTGPSLLPPGGAVLEAIVFGAAGALAGFTYAIWRHRVPA